MCDVRHHVTDGGEGVVHNVMSRSGVPIIDFLSVENRSYNGVFKIRSMILIPHPKTYPLSAKVECVGKSPFKTGLGTPRPLLYKWLYKLPTP